MAGRHLALTSQLAPPERWRLLGEGGANWVFAWDGDTPQLVSEPAEPRYGVPAGRCRRSPPASAADSLPTTTTVLLSLCQAGRVLRVRKPCTQVPFVQAALEAAVWAPALGSDVTGAAASDGAAAAIAAAAAREQRYVERMLAPLLGEQHIAQAQPVAVDAAYLHAVLAANGCQAAAGSAGSGSGGGSPGPAVLLPDATLLPDGSGGVYGSTHDGSGASDAGSTGPVVCLELKPKCGFVVECATVHPANRGLKRHRSRYQLHQQLKLAEVGGRVS